MFYDSPKTKNRESGNYLERWFRRWASELIVWPVSEILCRLERKINDMANELAALTAQVAANTTVIDSAIVLIQGIKAKLDAAGTDAAKLQALSNELGESNQELADAVAANTPAEEQ